MTRTTGTGRFTATQPDAIDAPATGTISGQKPFIWMTGGATRADEDPSTAGMDRILNGLTAAGYTICQPNIPEGSAGTNPQNTAFFGNDLCITRMNDAIAYARTNLGATNDPPILMGLSNGSVASFVYARQYPVSGIIGILPVSDAVACYNSDIYSLRANIQYAWSITDVSQLPPRASPYQDALNYPDLWGKVQAWYVGDDELYVAQEMSFLTQIHAEMHNVGAYQHVMSLTAAPYSTQHIDLTRLIAFVGTL